MAPTATDGSFFTRSAPTPGRWSPGHRRIAGRERTQRHLRTALRVGPGHRAIRSNRSAVTPTGRVDSPPGADHDHLAPASSPRRKPGLFTRIIRSGVGPGLVVDATRTTSGRSSRSCGGVPETPCTRSSTTLAIPIDAPPLCQHVGGSGAGRTDLRASRYRIRRRLLPHCALTRPPSSGHFRPPLPARDGRIHRQRRRPVDRAVMQHRG